MVCGDRCQRRAESRAASASRGITQPARGRFPCGYRGRCPQVCRGGYVRPKGCCDCCGRSTCLHRKTPIGIGASLRTVSVVERDGLEFSVPLSRKASELPIRPIAVRPFCRPAPHPGSRFQTAWLPDEPARFPSGGQPPFLNACWAFSLLCRWRGRLSLTPREEARMLTR